MKLLYTIATYLHPLLALSKEKLMTSPGRHVARLSKGHVHRHSLSHFVQTDYFFFFFGSAPGLSAKDPRPLNMSRYNMTKGVTLTEILEGLVVFVITDLRKSLHSLPITCSAREVVV